MPEETPQLPISEQEIQIEAPGFLEKLKLQKKKVLIGLGVFLGVLAITGVVLGAYLIWQVKVYPEAGRESTPTPLLSPGLVVQGYSFEWEEKIGRARVLKNGEEVLNFEIEEIPINVYFNPFSQNVAIVTVKNKIDNPHSLKVFSDGKLKTIYQGRGKEDNEDGVDFTKEFLYDFWDSEESYQKYYKNDIKFSPYGDFINFPVLVYEGVSTRMINIDPGEDYFDDEYKKIPGQIYWSPDGSNYVLINASAMYGADVLGGLGVKNLRRFRLETDDEIKLKLIEGNSYELYWRDNVKGLIYFNSNLSLVFDLDKKIVVMNDGPVDLSDYIEDKVSEYNLNLFFQLSD